MHKILFAMLLMASTATAAFAEEPAAAGAPPAAASGEKGGDGPRGKRPDWENMSFDEHKKKALEGIAKRKESLAKKEACVNAAADKEQLKACFPHHKRGEGGGWGGKGKFRKGGGQGGAPGDDMPGED